MSITVVIVPGIGGHPAFHKPLITAIGRHNLVYTWPHGDFSRQPFSCLDQHRAYWKDLIDQITASEIIIIGISFGAHIAISLPPLLTKSVIGVILLSYWPIGRVEHWALRLAKRLPEPISSRILGLSLLLWSNMTADDTTELKRTRATLYDSLPTVYRRIRARILCLDTAPGISSELRSASIPFIFVYGKRELVLRLHGSFISQLGQSSQMRVILLDASHAMSTSSNESLSSLINTLLEYFHD